MCKRLSLVLIGFVLIMSLLSYGVFAADEFPIEQYPHEDLKIIVGYGVGGGTDLVCRVLSRGLSKYLGTRVYVENISGGGGVIGIVETVRSKPDGRTVGTVAGGPYVVAPVVKGVPYDVDKDVVHIAHYLDFASAIWVRADSPFKTFDDLVKYGQEHPGELIYAAEEAVGMMATAFKVLSQIAGPFEYSFLATEGGGETVRLLINGDVDVINKSIPATIKFYEEGMIRPILVNSSKPIKGIPEDVPLAPVVYPEYTPIMSSGGVVGPAGFPEKERQMLENAIKWIIEDPEFQKEFDKISATMHYMSGKESAEHFAYLRDMIREILEEEK